MSNNLNRSRRSIAISEWSLKNFKSVKSARVELAPLSILIGKNSSGKSSLIQSILLLAQNSQAVSETNGTLPRLDLNGLLVNLGIFQEVLNSDTPKTERDIHISGKSNTNLMSPAIGMGMRNARRSPSGLEIDPINPYVNLRDFETAWSMVLSSPGKGVTTGMVNVKESEATLIKSNKKIQVISAKRRNRNTSESNLVHGEFDKNMPGTLKGIKSDLSSDFSFQGNLKFDAMSFYGGIPFAGVVSSKKFDALIAANEKIWCSLSDRLGSEFRRTIRTGENFFANVSKATGAKQGSGYGTYELPIEFGTMTEAKNHFVSLFGHFMNETDFSSFETLQSLEQNIGYLIPPFSLPVIVKIPLKSQRDFVLKREKLIRERDVISEQTRSLRKAALSFARRQLTLQPNQSAEAIKRLELEIESIDLEIQSLGDPEDTLTEMTLPEFVAGNVSGVTMGSLTNNFSQIQDSLVSEIERFWRDVKESLIGKFSNSKIGQEIFYHLPPDVTFSLRQVEDAAYSLVSNGVRRVNQTLKKVVYLGPLRLEPRNIYDRAVSQISQQLPLGLKGELLARRIYENEVDRYPVPPKEGRDDVIKTSFKGALNEWLFYLGLAQAQGLEVTPEASFGYKLLVDGRGLPAMGTGVSQVLPVIALCLVIPEGGLGLLEEPELHLNPAIQQKLGDFFLAVSKSNRQLIVETHSEYLVTRLRLRAAEDVDLRDQFNFIFTEWDKESGTVYRPITPGDDGLIHDWPKGFFDQAGTDVRALLKIVASKPD